MVSFDSMDSDEFSREAWKALWHLQSRHASSTWKFTWKFNLEILFGSSTSTFDTVESTGSTWNTNFELGTSWSSKFRTPKFQTGRLFATREVPLENKKLVRVQSQYLPLLLELCSQLCGTPVWRTGNCIESPFERSARWEEGEIGLVRFIRIHSFEFVGVCWNLLEFVVGIHWNSITFFGTFLASKSLLRRFSKKSLLREIFEGWSKGSEEHYWKLLKIIIILYGHWSEVDTVKWTVQLNCL